MEGYYQLKPACYESPEINPEKPNCWKGSPFLSQYASNEMADSSTFLRPDTTVIGNDNFHRASSVTPYHHPLTNGTCSLNTTGPCSFESITITENNYDSNNDFTKDKTF